MTLPLRSTPGRSQRAPRTPRALAEDRADRPATIGSVCRYAIVTDRAETDPTASLKGALLKTQVTHRPAITDTQQLGALWENLAEYDGWPTLKAAIQYLALTMARPIAGAPAEEARGAAETGRVERSG